MITPKSPEVIQAQIAVFADETFSHGGDSSYLVTHAAALAQEPLHDVTRTLEREEWVHPEAGTAYQLEVGSLRATARGDSYVAFLRAVGGMAYERILQRSELLASYARFKPRIDRMQAQGYPLEYRSGFIGSGNNAATFELVEGEEVFVARMSKDPGRTLDIEHYLGALQLRDHPHLEQIVAISYAEGVTIARKMPGCDMEQMSAEALRQVPDRQLAELLDTIEVAHRAGIAVDSSPSNYFYDPKAGFGIVDLYASDARPNQLSMIEVLTGLVYALSGTTVWGYFATSKARFAELADKAEALIPVLERFQMLCGQRYAGRTLAAVERNVQTRSSQLRKDIRHFRNNRWVEQQIRQNMLLTR